MSTYSFQNVTATITGFGGSIKIGEGSGAAAEGLTITMANDKNVMLTGADKHVAHSLISNNAAQLTVRLLKTSATNQELSNMMNLQVQDARTHGLNTVVLNDTARGDFLTMFQVAFKKMPDLAYATEAGMNEWAFDVARVESTLGPGTPEAN